MSAALAIAAQPATPRAANDNILTKSIGTRNLTMSYDSRNRLSSHTDSAGPNRQVQYDNRGNITNLGGLSFFYDIADQPIWVYGANGGGLRYDGNLKRVKSGLGGKVIYNVYNAAGQLVYIDNVTTGEKTEYLRLGDMTIANIVKSGAVDTVTYLHADHLGSAQTGTNAIGAKVWAEQYSAFGQTKDNAPANDNRAGYTPRHCRGLLRVDLIHRIKSLGCAQPTSKHIKDSATGLNYMQARYYDPLIGRFLSIDPVDFVASGYKPSMFNRYAYVANDPINGVDPDGLAAFGVNVEAQLAILSGGRLKFEAAVDTGTGEIRARLLLGERVGLRGKAKVSGFVEPSSKIGNEVSVKHALSGDASVEVHSGPLFTGEASIEGDIGVKASTSTGLSLDKQLDTNLQVKVGGVTTDTNGRTAIAVGGGLGGSVGTDTTISANISLSDTLNTISSKINIVGQMSRLGKETED